MGRPDDQILTASLADRYRPERVLGAGGFGRVILATDLELERPVALKVMNADLGDPDMRLRFEREARVTAGLQHPNVVRVYGFGIDDDGSPYIAYEYVEGTVLGALVGRDVEVGRLLVWAGQLADALDAVHRAGVVHRDVKPGNILIRAADDGAVLCDFGIARVESGATVATQQGVLLGTPGFLAPEVWIGDPVSPASDQFAWAASLVQVLEGRTVYGFEEVAAVAQSLRLYRPPTLEGRSDLPPEAVAALRRALARNPAERFPSMAEAAAALLGGDAGPALPGSTMALDRGGAASSAGIPGIPGAGHGPATVSGVRPRTGTASRVGLGSRSLAALPVATAMPPRAPGRRAAVGPPVAVGLALALAAGWRWGGSPETGDPNRGPATTAPVAGEDAWDDVVKARDDLASLFRGVARTNPWSLYEGGIHVTQLQDGLVDPRLPPKWTRFLESLEIWEAEATRPGAETPPSPRSVSSRLRRAAIFSGEISGSFGHLGDKSIMRAGNASVAEVLRAAEANRHEVEKELEDFLARFPAELGPGRTATGAMRVRLAYQVRSLRLGDFLADLARSVEGTREPAFLADAVEAVGPAFSRSRQLQAEECRSVDDVLAGFAESLSSPWDEVELCRALVQARESQLEAIRACGGAGLGSSKGFARYRYLLDATASCLPHLASASPLPGVTGLERDRLALDELVKLKVEVPDDLAEKVSQLLGAWSRGGR